MCANIMFVNSNGQNIRLAEFATITETSGPTVLERRDKLASVNVQAQVIGRPTGNGIGRVY
jgi:HAE1 family hydrophobic/amphiphilic exporter-1